MPEAVIVAASRSPIGRANRGSLNDLRADGLAATIVRTALDHVPALETHEIDDIMLGCGMPGGEQGFNMARVVSILAPLLRGYRGSPACDIEAVIDVVEAVGSVLASSSGISDVEINPLLARPTGAIALDARVIST